MMPMFKKLLGKMMVTRKGLCLASLLSLFVGSNAAFTSSASQVQRKRRELGRSAAFEPERMLQSRTSSHQHLTRLRAGGIVSSAVSVPTVVVTQSWAALCFLNGALMALAPALGAKILFGAEATQDDGFGIYLIQAIGCVLVGHGLLVYLATATNVTVQRALGYGILVRLLFLFKSFLVRRMFKNARHSTLLVS
jgi:hypothetical protein